LPEPSTSYDERYVAFIDVLGFADLVARSETSPEIVARLSRTLSALSERAQLARSEELHIEAASFSDTIVLSSPALPDALLRLLEIVDELSFELISGNMLFRGAIVRGHLLHTTAFVFGPALVAAYRLETHTSFHPRIMFDPIVYAATKEDERFGRYVVTDSYDVPYLNPFARWHSGSLDAAAVGQLVKLQGIIAAGLMAGANNPSIGEKYKWLGRKLNRFISTREPSTGLQALTID
jgi:hypothetical protein